MKRKKDIDKFIAAYKSSKRPTLKPKQVEAEYQRLFGKPARFLSGAKQGQIKGVFNEFAETLARSGISNYVPDPSKRVHTLPDGQREIRQRHWVQEGRFDVPVRTRKEGTPPIRVMYTANFRGSKAAALAYFAANRDALIRAAAINDGSLYEYDEFDEPTLIQSKTTEITDRRAYRVNSLSHEFKCVIPHTENFTTEKRGCGYHALQWRLGNRAGMKLKARNYAIYNWVRGTQHKSWDDVVNAAPANGTDEELDEYFGLWLFEMRQWCEAHGVSCYLLDEAENTLEQYTHPRATSSATSHCICAIIKNEHIHLITTQSKINSISQRYTSTAKQNKAKKTTLAELDTPTNITEIDTDLPENADTMTFLTNKVKEHGVIPHQDQLKVIPKGTTWRLKQVDFNIDDDSIIRYKIDWRSRDAAKEILRIWKDSGNPMLIGDKPITELNSPEHLASLLVQHHMGRHGGYSTLPPDVNEALEAKKDLFYYGLTPSGKGSSAFPEGSVCYDVCGNDPNALLNPPDEWCVFGACSVVREAPTDYKQPGLYYYNGGVINLDEVKPHWERHTGGARGDYVLCEGNEQINAAADQWLMTGAGLYPRIIVQTAIDDGLISPDDITAFIPAEYTITKNFFKDLFNKIDSIFGVAPKDEATKALRKKIRCLIPGILGSNNYTRHRAALSPSLTDAINGLNQAKNPFFQSNDDEELSLYMTGDCENFARHRTTLPFYHQQLCFGNLVIYQHMKRLGGVEHTLYRHRDAFVAAPGHTPPKLGKKLGQLKIEPLPSRMENIRHKNLAQPRILTLSTSKKPDGTDYTSNDIENIYKIFEDSGGLLINGEGGTGKTYLTRAIVERLREECYRVKVVAPTNKAANHHVGGNTLHKLFGLSFEKSSCEDDKVFLRIADKYNVIVVDEISMVSSQFIAQLGYLKSLGVRLILVGDFAQLGAVETNPIYADGFEDHPYIAYLTNGTRIDLAWHEKCRYDTKLRTLANLAKTTDDVAAMRAMTSKNKSIKKTNIAYTNRKVVAVNKQVLQHVLKTERPKNQVELPKSPASWALDKRSQMREWANQAWTIFPGQKLIIDTANKNIPHAKNETIVILEINDGVMKFAAQNGIPKFTLPVEQFWDFLRPAYCITCHRAQGDTITEPYNIHEFSFPRVSRKWRNTALTRATCCDHITIM